jgi:Uma2 family endonuclease
MSMLGHEPRMPVPPVTTAEQLYALPDRKRYELDRGALRVREPPGGVHGRVATRLAHLLHGHVERHDLGTVLVQAGYVLARSPDTVRGPDLSFVGKARMTAEQVPETFIPGTPDLAVEILSPEDRPGEIDEKVADYLRARARQVWIVDPRHHGIVIHYPGRPALALRRADTLTGDDVVLGFACPVAEVFGSTQDP